MTAQNLNSLESPAFRRLAGRVLGWLGMGRRATPRWRSALFLGATFVALCAQAQTDDGYVTSTVKADVVSFQCQQSFTGHGIGVCSGRIDVSLRDVRRPLKAADFRCEVLIRSWWVEDRAWRSEIKTLNLAGSAERLGMRFANATLEFETDLTSVVREPRHAEIARSRCEAEWKG